MLDISHFKLRVNKGKVRMNKDPFKIVRKTNQTFMNREYEFPPSQEKKKKKREKLKSISFSACLPYPKLGTWVCRRQILRGGRRKVLLHNELLSHKYSEILKKTIKPIEQIH